MNKFEQLDELLQKNNGFLKTADVIDAGISKTYLGNYVRERDLERVALGVYMSQDAWVDEMYVLQARFPQIVFSHETALYLWDLAEREPLKYTVTAKSTLNTTNISRQGVKVYKVIEERYNVGITEVDSPAGHSLKVYNPERTICDLIRSKRNVEIQDFQTALRGYVRYKEKNLSLLLKYAQQFQIEKTLRQYLEVLLV